MNINILSLRWRTADETHLWSLEIQDSTWCKLLYSVQYSSVQLLSHVRLFVNPWTTARQASLSITNSQSPSKPMSIESVMPFNHLILCHPVLLLLSIFPSIKVFSNESVGQSIGVSASASVLPMNTRDWSALGGLVGSPCSSRDSQESLFGANVNSVSDHKF